jgi:LacI family transcriptional regulator
LVELGHTRIAFAGGPRTSLETSERLSGVRDALTNRGLPGPTETWFGTECTPDAGEVYANHFLAQPLELRPTAVILGDDSMALGFSREALRRGLKIPDDVSVVGFGGSPMGALFWPPLTTVQRPIRRMADRACGVLLAAMQGDEPLENVRVTENEVELLIRDSSGRPSPAS